MKIKTIIIISYFIIIGAIAAMVTIANLVVVERTTKDNINAMLKYEEMAAIKSMQSAHSIMLPYGRAHIHMETKIVAQQLSSILRMDKIKNESQLKADKRLRDTAPKASKPRGKLSAIWSCSTTKATLF